MEVIKKNMILMDPTDKDGQKTIKVDKFKVKMISQVKGYDNEQKEKAKQLLWHTNMSILEVSILTGFPSSSYLSRVYRQEFGVLPSDERRKLALQ